MNKMEKIFFAVWGIVLFPLIMLFLVMKCNLDLKLVPSFLTFMASISGVYLGARGFDNWNSTPDPEEEGSATPDDGGH